MSSSQSPSVTPTDGSLYLLGVGVTHSIAPPMHNFILNSLGHERWHFRAQECPTVEDALALCRHPTFAGAVVTMPYKTTIMAHLDGLDDHARKLGACNNVYRASDGSLRGTNTDWRGIKGCLLGAQGAANTTDQPALIIGAGGASRAAVYALHEELGCNPIYVVNRDSQEVSSLRDDAKVYGDKLQLVHIASAEQARGLERPVYIVGTVPDFEPQTTEELEVRSVLETFLSMAGEGTGTVLDMCFKPRMTRTLKLAKRYGWTTVEGTEIIGHQIEEQYRLWCGEEQSKVLPKEAAWAVLRQAAEESPAINF